MGNLILALLSVAAAAQVLSDWNLRDHVPLEEVVVQSHRGAGVLMPENSIDAFELAWKLGTVPEGDLRTTRDGVIVTFHDEDFHRILPQASSERQKLGIKDLTWREVSALDIGAWKGAQFAGQRVPRVSEVFQILQRHRRRRFYVDIKNVDLEQLAREANDAGVARQLILASTDYPFIRRWKELAPDSSTLHWMGGAETQLARRLDELEKAGFASITQLQIHVRVKEGAMSPSERFLLETGRRLRGHGIVFQTLPWQSNDPAVFQRLMDLGAASFATDYPDVAMRTIREYYAQSHADAAKKR